MICDYYSGLSLLRKGDLNGAEARSSAIKNAVETIIHDELYLNYSYDLIGEINLSRGRAIEAVAAIGKLSGLHRRVSPRARMLDARIAVQQGDRAAALKTYDRTYNFVWSATSVFGGDWLDFWIEQSKLDYYKGQMYEHFGDKTEAIKFYEKAIYNWRNADKDYVNLVDAKARLAKLSGKK